MTIPQEQVVGAIVILACAITILWRKASVDTKTVQTKLEQCHSEHLQAQKFMGQLQERIGHLEGLQEGHVAGYARAAEDLKETARELHNTGNT